MSAEVLDDLALARAEFDRWRAHSAGRGRIPAQLWALALSLVGTRSVAAVARELGLNQDRLRARVEQGSAIAPKRRASKPRFLELRPAERVTSATLGAVTATQPRLEVGARIRIDRPDATSLTLELAPDRFDVLERLVASFSRSAS
jgi:transposase-like protein